MLLLLLTSSSLFSQPTKFTWREKHTGHIDPISTAKDQRYQGSCTAFAAVAAVEAMASIYYNKNATHLNLSESSYYNAGIDADCLGNACNAGSDVPAALNFIMNTGLIDNQSYAYPTTGGICRDDCQDIFDVGNYSTRVKIPGWDTLCLDEEHELKEAIMDYGPIIVTMSTNDNNQYIGCALHPGGTCTYNHTVLVIGWDNTDELKWHIKDSWPGDDSISYVSTNDVDIFDFHPQFYYVKPVVGTQTINCTGTGCYEVFDCIEYEDFDKDGFYNWGFDKTKKPESCPGIHKMDMDDGNPNVIFRDGYDILGGPYISDTTTSKYIGCTGKQLTLENFDELPSGFSCNWKLTPGYYFTSSSGSGEIVYVNPHASYYGKKCKLEYELHYGSTGTESDTLVTTYKFEFYINGPREDLVSLSVLDSYGGSPEKYGDTYYLCPYTNYLITYNNNYNACTTSSFNWKRPYGWTENWAYNDQVSINTNDNPSGFLYTEAHTCCSGEGRDTILSSYFGEAECGEYFMAYPNPTSSYVIIDVIKEKFTSGEISNDSECLLSVLDRSGIIKNKHKFNVFPYRFDTSNLQDGLYFFNLKWNGKQSTIQLVIKRN